MKDNKHGTFIAAKICSDVCPRTLSVILSIKAHSLPELAMLVKNYSLLGTDSVREKHPSIFLHQIEAIVHFLTRYLKEM